MEKLIQLRSYITDRLQESSTWRGLILIATGCGAAINQEVQEAIVAGGMILAGMMGAISKDKSHDK